MTRKLDAAVAEGLGYEVVIKPADGEYEADYYMRLPSKEYVEIPLYSTDGNAMSELIGEMQRRGWRYSFISDVFKFRREGMAYAGVAESLPLAVTLAAYKALTGKEWVE